MIIVVCGQFPVKERKNEKERKKKKERETVREERERGERVGERDGESDLERGRWGQRWEEVETWTWTSFQHIFWLIFQCHPPLEIKFVK
jgi:hypothetical protein